LYPLRFAEQTALEQVTACAAILIRSSERITQPYIDADDHPAYILFTEHTFFFRDAHLMSGRTLVVLGVALSTALAQAQQFPTHPLKWIVPYSVAGASDAAARLMAQRMEPILGQTVVVENRAGAGGVIGTDAVAKAAPDGYTFAWGGSNALAGSVVLQKNVPYSATKDFSPVCRIGTISYVLVVNPSLGVHSLSELISLAKSSKQPIPYASPGNGGASHLAMETLEAKSGTTFLNVQYKGTAPGITDLLGGFVSVMFESVPVVSPLLESGKLVALATTGPRRLAGLPNVPTMTELGMKDFVVQGWAGILLPAGASASVVSALDNACRSVLEQPDVQEIMTRRLGWEVEYLGAAPFGSFVKSEVVHWAGMLATAKVKPE
jgi:tripartite-type tricarboxylate transporter receptor subunit TctC